MRGEFVDIARDLAKSRCRLFESRKFTSGPWLKFAERNMSLVKFTGTDNLRYRLVLSILSGKPVRIDGIRSEDKDPGLRGQSFNVYWSN